MMKDHDLGIILDQRLCSEINIVIWLHILYCLFSKCFFIDEHAFIITPIL